MEFRFSVLGSGSSGNATLVETSQTHLLIDVGFSGEELERRLGHVGVSWSQITHVCLTHCHADHVRASALHLCRKTKVPVFCHSSHEETLFRKSRNIETLKREGLLIHFDPGPFHVGDLLVKPLEVSHDDVGNTFGFVLTTCNVDRSVKASMVTDLGFAPNALAGELANSDILAIEHNHDPELLWQSRRPGVLKKRIRSHQGHLSNLQAAQLLMKTMKMSIQTFPKHVFLMHMSQECNETELALTEIEETLREIPCHPAYHVTSQDVPISVVLSEEDPESSRIATCPRVKEMGAERSPRNASILGTAR